MAGNNTPEQCLAFLADRTPARKHVFGDRFVANNWITRAQVNAALPPRPSDDEMAAELALMERERQERLASRPAAKLPPADGPGAELSRIFDSLGLETCPACQSLAGAMSRWGSVGCRLRYWTIVGTLKDRAAQRPVGEWITAAGMAVLTGLAFKINWSDPIPDLVMLAITRAEAKGL